RESKRRHTGGSSPSSTQPETPGNKMPDLRRPKRAADYIAEGPGTPLRSSTLQVPLQAFAVEVVGAHEVPVREQHGDAAAVLGLQVRVIGDIDDLDTSCVSRRQDGGKLLEHPLAQRAFRARQDS